MKNEWSFGRKIGVGFALAVALTVAVGWIGAYALRRVVNAKDRVLSRTATALVDGQRFEANVEAEVSAIRGYALTREPHYLEEWSSVRAEALKIMGHLRAGATQRAALAEDVARAEEDYFHAQQALVELVKRGGSPAEISQSLVSDLRPGRRQLRTAVDALVSAEEQALKVETQEGTRIASSAIEQVVMLTAFVGLLAAVVAALLVRTLSRQIGSAVGQVQSSSAELQAAANQQAASSREQSTAMAEITTTISELLATSRQIAESSQRVAQMAAQTAGSARSGDETVARARESIAGIQRQVELVVGHMLDLGKKSQQIGVVLDIVSELAEQTNILAINATIEATGAGDAGRRFGVVADEIRKLADRVAGSTKEIRRLIEEVRSAVNTTVMVTETGSKAVDAGTRQFGDVTTALRQIGGLVSSTTDAAREIELSTKQQSTAVEQVNVAIANVAQASKESEVSSAQTLQTASQLATLSKDLLRLIRPDKAA